jgi:hypothetical protein
LVGSEWKEVEFKETGLKKIPRRLMLRDEMISVFIETVKLKKRKNTAHGEGNIICAVWRTCVA